MIRKPLSISTSCCTAAIASFGLLALVDNAFAYQNCSNLPRGSAAYYSCEALNGQERDRQERAKEQEYRDLIERSDRLFRQAQPSPRYQPQVVQPTESLPRKEPRAVNRTEAAAEHPELYRFMQTVAAAMSAVSERECAPAQTAVDELKTMMSGLKPRYSLQDKLVTRVDLENGYVALQVQVYSTCIAGAEGVKKTQAFLQQEARSGNPAARQLLAALGEEMDKTTAREAKVRAGGRDIPRFADYGTDLASLQKYLEDLEAADLKSCTAAFARNDANAAFCLSQRESGANKIALLREASRLGHPLAKNNLAMELDDSNPVGFSSEIVRLIRSAAQSGIPHAQVTLGWWHMTAKHGVKVNYAEAMRWNLAGYKQGHPEGANNIGELHEKGLGVPKSLDQAKSWYKKASVLGNEEAAERLRRLSP